MATPNYSYEKRQRELAKKRKKEEKAARKAAGPGHATEQAEPGEGQAAEGDNAAADTPEGEAPAA